MQKEHLMHADAYGWKWLKIVEMYAGKVIARYDPKQQSWGGGGVITPTAFSKVGKDGFNES